jgi:hypothetical protein
MLTEKQTIKVMLMKPKMEIRTVLGLEPKGNHVA